MRRVVSYGGPSGVPASQRLKHKLSSTPGLHLLSSNSVEGGFLAAVEDPQDERVIHKTSWATRNFFATASALKKASKREPWAIPENLFVPTVKARTIFDEPVEADKHYHAVFPTTHPGNENNAEYRDGRIRVRVDDGANAREIYDSPDSNTQKPAETLVSSDEDKSSSGHLTNTTVSAFLDNENDLHAVISKSDTGDSIGESSSLQSVASLWITKEDLGNVACQNTAAVKIQSCCRGWLQRRRFVKFKGSVVILQSLVRRNQELKRFQTISKAVAVLQKNWRVVQSMRVLKHLMTEQAAREQHSIENAAVVIQKHWRAIKSIRLVKCLRMEQAAMEQQRISNAATVIQKHWRADKARRLLKYLKMERFVRTQERIEHAAVVLQKNCRALKSRRLLEHLKMEQATRKQQKVVDATLVLQKNWRSVQSRRLLNHMKMEQVTREQQIVDNATIVLQKYWRAFQGRRLVERLKMEKVEGERLRIEKAAVILQQHWRAVQSRCLTKHLLMEQALREQQMAENAGGVLQKHWRSAQRRLILKRLKIEQAMTEQQKINKAANVLQKHWRSLQSRLTVKYLKMEQVRRQQAAIHIQAHVRGHVSRAKLRSWHSAALAIQKVWRQHWSFQQTVSAVSTQQTFCSFSDQKRKIQAVLVLQAYVRGLAVRRKLHQMLKIADPALQPDYTCKELFGEAGGSANPEMVLLSDLDLQPSQEQRAFDFKPDSLVVQHDVYVQSADQILDGQDSLERLNHEIVPAVQNGGPTFSQGLYGVFSETTVGDFHLQTNEGKEDWNYVAVDHLDECRDTCLAVRRPLPPTLPVSSIAEQCLPKLDVPETAQQLQTSYMYLNPTERTQVVDRVHAPPGVPTSTSCTPQYVPGEFSGIGESENECFVEAVALSNAPRVQVDQAPCPGHGNSDAPQLLATVDLSDDRGLQQESVSDQVIHKESILQGDGHRRQSVNQNEKRLQQFAQVFLLQRQIALQQQRAQAAPPFPPHTPSGFGCSHHLTTRSLEAQTSVNGSRRLVAVQNMDADVTAGQVAIVSTVEPNLVYETGNSCEELTLRKQPQGSQNETLPTEQVSLTERPVTDVVLDMVLLLRQVEEEYGTSDIDYDRERSTCFPSRCGDIEESLPLLGRDVGLISKQNSMVNFANAVSIRRIGMPDVNAVLLVLIAMVVYTRTICQGVFFGTRQTNRKV